MKQVRTAVLIHGCHLQAELGDKDWHDIAIGGARPTLAGRAVMGVKVAMDHDAHLVIFSTGASQSVDGVKEGDYTHRVVKADSDYIAEAIGRSEEELLAFLRAKSELDLESQNTREECERNFALCAERGIERLILVSSPWHIQRCHTEALKVAEDMRAEGKAVPEIMAVASHGSTEGVVIFEPSHRGDRPKNRFSQFGARFFKVAADQLEPFHQGLDQLLTRFGA